MKLSLRTRIFLRLSGLLTLLILAVSLSAAIALIINYREQAQDIYTRQIRILALQSDDLLLWDDRLALQALLKLAVRDDPAIGYAFVERGKTPYLHTFGKGVPKDLVGLADSSAKMPQVRRLEDNYGRGWDDIAVAVGKSDTYLHLGIARAEISRRALAKTWAIATFGGVALLVGFLLTSGIAAVTTREFDQTTNSLRESERQFRIIFNQTFQFVGLITPDGMLIKSNRSTLDFGGIADSDILNKPFWEAPWWTHSREMQDRLRDAITRAAAGERVFFEAWYPATDGCVHYLDCTIQPVKDEAGNVSLLIPEAHDITDRKQTVEELRIKDHAIASSLNGIVLTDLEGKVTYANRAFLDMWGFEHEEEVLGRPNTELAFSADRVREIMESARTQGGWVGEDTARKKDGTPFDIELSVAMVTDPDGAPVSVMASFMDISDRKRAEGELRKEIVFNKTLIEACPLYFVAISAAGKTLMMNESMLKALGYTADEVRDTDYLATFVPEDDVESLEKIFRTLMAQRKATLNENHVLTKAGRQLLVEWHGRPVFKEDGEFDFFFGVGIDITERRRMEQQTRLLSSAVEQTSEGIAVADLEGRLLFLNKAFASMHGYASEELRDQYLSVFHTPDQMPSFEVANRQLREVGEFSGEVWHARRDGTVFPGLMRNSLLRDNAGNPVGLIGTVRDITDIKQVEEQLRTSVREKEVLLREIHHRVKNNMQVISSLLNIQSTYFKDKRSMEMFKETQNRVTSMALVHEQLYHSEDMGRVEFEKHVRSLISHLFCSYGVTSGRVTLKTNIEDIPLSLDIAIPCGLIVNELASNALKHGFSSGIEGEIRIGLTFDGGQYTLVVFNNGKAFPVDLDFHATGTMGLQVVTTLARQLEGTMELDRQGGTTFTITFPESQ